MLDVLIVEAILESIVEDDKEEDDVNEARYHESQLEVFLPKF